MLSFVSTLFVNVIAFSVCIFVPPALEAAILVVNNISQNAIRYILCGFVHYFYIYAAWKCQSRVVLKTVINMCVVYVLIFLQKGEWPLFGELMISYIINGHVYKSIVLNSEAKTMT